MKGVCVFLGVIIVAACVHALEHACICKGFTETSIPGCTLKGKGCECLHLEGNDLHLKKYRTEFTDESTNVCGGYSPMVNSKTQSGELALVQLFQKDNGCNCNGTDNVPLGQCKVNYKTCFFFSSTGAISSKNPSFRLFAQVVAPTKLPQLELIAANETALKTIAVAMYQHIVAQNKNCSVTDEMMLPHVFIPPQL